MNAMLQRHCARYIYVVPEGLRELMSDISREVLRSQPQQNIYGFIADYLDALMITRENARVAARLIQSITEISTATVEFLQNTGMTRDEADQVIAIIQKTFKKHIELVEVLPDLFKSNYACVNGVLYECISVLTVLNKNVIIPKEIEEANIISNIINEANITPEQAEEAALIIQRAFRAFKLRREKERELLSGMIDWRIAARSAIQLYRRTGVTNEEANRAATLIKAAYKGYYTRRVLRKLAAESKFIHEGPPTVEEPEEEADEHADLRVSINYETVIPHVDFAEPAFGEGHSLIEVKQGDSTTIDVVAYAIEEILETAFPLTEEEIKFREMQLQQQMARQVEVPEVTEEILEVKHEPEEETEIKQEPEEPLEIKQEILEPAEESQQLEEIPPDHGEPEGTELAEDVKHEAAEEVAPSETAAEPAADVQPPEGEQEEVKQEEVKQEEVKQEEEKPQEETGHTEDTTPEGAKAGEQAPAEVKVEANEPSPEPTEEKPSE
ncbi:hypothetical protein NQ317_008566 [Molorchus minor]|uniref:RIIa domain-containing protein n=1 Tax=Molorchus minor TaxID=1323400 RepID=A0ABQ9JS64_9CUCU|nr:hypothetical protein NQ317_008566 [Molorchus minor]